MTAKKKATVFTALLVSVALLGLGQRSFAQGPISASDAKDHIGERQTVCGSVVGTHYAARSRGNPTFINLDKPYPHQIFSLVIWGSDRSKFGDPEQLYRDKHICVTGTITEYKGVPEMAAYGPIQVKVE